MDLPSLAQRLQGLAQTLVAWCMERIDAGDLPEPPREWIVSENRWLAARYGIDATLSPEVFVVLANALGQVLVMEDALGLDAGHAAARAAVEDLLTRYEGPRRRGSGEHDR